MSPRTPSPAQRASRRRSSALQAPAREPGAGLSKTDRDLARSSLGAVRWLPDGTIVLWTAAMERQFGWPAGRVVGRRWDEIGFILPEDLPRARAAAEDIRSGRSLDRPFRTRNVTRSGRLVDTEWWSAPSEGPGGRIESILSLVVDVTEHQRVERELAAERDRADRMVAAFGHDLRNPLVTILGFGRLARRAAAESGTAELCEMLESIEAAGERLAALVDGLLEYAQVGALDATPQVVDLRTVIDSAIAAHALVVRERNVSIEVRLDAQDVVTDGHHLERLLANLIGNAVHHGCVNERNRIEVTTTPTDTAHQVATRSGATGGVAICVRDFGPGIAPEDRERVFRPAVRRVAAGASAGGATTSGLGLGLGVVLKLASLLGGRCWLDHPDAGGTAAWLLLPNLDQCG